MEFVEIFGDYSVSCSRDGKKYTYSFNDGSKIINKISEKSPLEHSKKSDIGKRIFEIVCSEPVEATSDKERNRVYEDNFDIILNELHELLNNEEFEQEKKEIENQKEITDSYENAYEKFKLNCKQLDYTPLEYLVRIFEGYGVNSHLEIFKAYLGYLQTLIGLKGTNVISVGLQSSGKSHLLENPLDCVPDEYVHRGTYTRASFFTEFAGQDLTHHVFYLGDLGGDNDDMNTIEFRDVMKELSTDGYVSRNYKEEGEVVTEEIKGYPALIYSTVVEEMINDQEKSRSVVIMPPDVDKELLMIYDSFNEAPASDFQLKVDIEKTKNYVKGYSWYLMNTFEDIELYNPYMFAVQNYLNNMDDFNRKIKEFNMLLKLVVYLDNGFNLTHNLYYDLESQEPIETRLYIASKRDVVNTLNLFEGSSGLLPTEVALLKGLLDNYACYNDVELLDYPNKESDKDISFEESVINYLSSDEYDVTDSTNLHYTMDEVTNKPYIVEWDNSYPHPETDEEVYVWFTVNKIKQVFKNNRWYRNISKNLSEKLMKLHEFGMLIKIGKTQDGLNVYGINYGVEDLINNIEPNWDKSAIQKGIEEFHRKYPSLSDEFDEFIQQDKLTNIKFTDMEIRDGGLYDLPWRR